MKTIKNELPPRFESFCYLYDYISNRILPSHTEINYAEHGIDTVWEFSIDFIKARCFEEILKLYPPNYQIDYAGPEWEWEALERIRVFEKKTKLGKLIKV